MKDFTATPSIGATCAPRTSRLVVTSVLAALCAGGLLQGQAHALTLKAGAKASILGTTAYPSPTGNKIQSLLETVVGGLTGKEQRAVSEFDLRGLKPVKKAILTVRVTGLTGLLGQNGLNLGVEAYTGNNLIDLSDYQSPVLGSQLLNTNLAGLVVGRELTVDVTTLLNTAIISGKPSLGIRVRPLSDPGLDLGLNLGDITIGTVDNTKPTVQNVSIKSSTSTPSTNGTLAVDVAASDTDQDTMTYTYVWRKNGVVIPNETGPTLDLSKPGNGDKGDKITVTVTASDGTTTSDPITSPVITIGNTLPAISGVTITRSGTVLTANVTVTDPDKDPLTYTYIWKRGNTVLSGETGPTLDLSKLPSGGNGDTVTVTVKANDGSADSAPITSSGFTIINTAPKVESLSPVNASDKVGNRRTFAVTMSDANGAGDIKEMWLLINDCLSWYAGATLIYVPSATSPTKGQLFLRSGDAFLAPLDIGVGSRAVLDNGAVNVSARDVQVTTAGNSIILSITATIGDGLVGTNRVFARVVDRAGGLDPTTLATDDGYRRFGNYTVAPQFKGANNNVPTLGRLQPGATQTTLSSAGLGPVQNFSFSAFDADGTGDIESVWFTAGKTMNWTNSATFIYTPRTRRLVLRSDDGLRFLGGGVIGSAGIIENSQVRIDLSKVRVQINADGKTLILLMPMQAKRGLLGQNKVYLRVQDLQRATAPNSEAQGYVLSGLWNVAQNTAASPSRPTS